MEHHQTGDVQGECRVFGIEYIGVWVVGLVAT